MNTKKIIEIHQKVFSQLKNIWEISDKWNKYNLILDNFLDELNIKCTPENRFIAYSRISDFRVEPLDLYLDEMSNKIDKNNKLNNIKIPNKLKDKRLVLNKAYNYTKKIYENLYETFLDEIEQEKVLDDFELTLFLWTFNVWKSFNNFAPIWENTIFKQNEILDKKFDNNSEKIMDFLNNKDLLELDEFWNCTDRSYSVLKGWKIMSYIEAFPNEIKSIIISLEDFIEDLDKFKWKQKDNYTNYLISIKNAFSQKEINKLLSNWKEVDEAWMKIKWPIQITHPLEFYEDKYRKATAPEWDLRILDTETLDSKVKNNIESMYEIIYDKTWREKYSESYNFSKQNFNRVGLYISEPIMYFWANLNWISSAQVVPNDEDVSEKFWKKIFAYPKMVLDSKRRAPLMKLTKEILDESILTQYLKILENDNLYFDVYDIETIGHEFWHTLWLTKNSEALMNKKTWNFKNIEEFKATAGWLCSYFYSNKKDNCDFDKDILIMHLARCIWLLKYREVVEILSYYNESLIHLDIMFESNIFEIKNNKIILNFNEQNWENLKNNYIKHYEYLINIYLEKIDSGEFLYNYVIKDKKWNYVSKNKTLQDFQNYYYDLYKKIWNEVA